MNIHNGLIILPYTPEVAINRTASPIVTATIPIKNFTGIDGLHFFLAKYSHNCDKGQPEVITPKPSKDANDAAGIVNPITSFKKKFINKQS